jgi:PGDYG protein
MSNVPDLRDDPNALRVCKRPDPIFVMFSQKDGVCATLEGPVRYRSGDAILTGVQQEKWPVAREAFLANYMPVPPTSPGADGRYAKRPSVTLALPIEREIKVPVGWRADPLLGLPGDWLLQYADGAHGVVRNEIFLASYDPAPGENRWPRSRA